MKNVMLALASYLSLFGVVYITDNYVKNSNLLRIILIICFLCISLVILFLKKPFKNNNHNYLLTNAKNSKIFLVEKIFLYIWIVLTIITKSYIGIISDKLFFPWNPDNTIINYIIIYFMLIIGAFTEELLFRYLIYNEILNKKMRKLFAILLTSLLFSFYHNNPTFLSFISRFLIGIQLNILFDIYPSIILVSGYHLFINLLVFIY